MSVTVSVEVTRTDIDVATMYDPTNWSGKSQDERETPSVYVRYRFSSK